MAADARAEWIASEVVMLSEAKRSFVLLPRRWVVDRSIASLRHFCHGAKDYGRLPKTVAGLHFLAFAWLLSSRAASCLPNVHIEREGTVGAGLGYA